MEKISCGRRSFLDLKAWVKMAYHAFLRGCLIFPLVLRCVQRLSPGVLVIAGKELGGLVVHA